MNISRCHEYALDKARENHICILRSEQLQRQYNYCNGSTNVLQLSFVVMFTSLSLFKETQPLEPGTRTCV